MKWTALAFSGLCLVSGACFADSVQEIRAAAEQGDARAQGVLGRMCYFGQGVKADPAEALMWLDNAAAQGDAVAQADLGMAYALAHQQALAQKWLRASAAQGNVQAGANLDLISRNDWDAVAAERKAQLAQAFTNATTDGMATMRGAVD